MYRNIPKASGLLYSSNHETHDLHTREKFCSHIKQQSLNLLNKIHLFSLVVIPRRLIISALIQIRARFFSQIVLHPLKEVTRFPKSSFIPSKVKTEINFFFQDVKGDEQLSKKKAKLKPLTKAAAAKKILKKKLKVNSKIVFNEEGEVSFGLDII